MEWLECSWGLQAPALGPRQGHAQTAVPHLRRTHGWRLAISALCHFILLSAPLHFCIDDTPAVSTPPPFPRLKPPVDPWSDQRASTGWDHSLPDQFTRLFSAALPSSHCPQTQTPQTSDSDSDSDSDSSASLVNVKSGISCNDLCQGRQEQGVLQAVPNKVPSPQRYARIHCFPLLLLLLLLHYSTTPLPSPPEPKTTGGE